VTEPIPEPAPLGAHVVPDAAAVAIAIERLRGETTTSIALLEGAWKLGLADLRNDATAIIRRLDYTNSKVAEHDVAIAGILKRHELDDEREALRRARWDERSRPLRLLARVGRLIISEQFVLRAGLGLVLALLGLQHLEMWL